MLYIVILKVLLNANTQFTYDYDRLMYIIAEKESRFQCQVVDPYGITYGKYQVTDYLIAANGYKRPMTCEQQDELMRKLIKMYEAMGGKYEFTYRRGIWLHKTNLVIAMHFAPYGTIKYLEGGEDFSNGLISVSTLLKRYEDVNLYKVKAPKTSVASK